MLMRFVVVFYLFFSTALSANEWQVLHPLLPKGTQLSYMVVDGKSQQTLTQYNQEVLRTPASMQKLLTATAARLHLGGDFRYQTALFGKKENIKKKVYQGDLRLKFVGDPTLKRADIKRMLITMKQLGINKIAGDFIINDAHFDGYQWSNGQPWNDLSVCYTAPSNTIVVNSNCVLGNLSLANKEAKKATLYIPNYEPVTITANVDVLTKEQRKAQFCDLEVTRNSQNNYHLWGCMVPRNRPFGLAFAVNDPFHYAAKIVESELEKLGIELSGDVILESEKYFAEADEVFASYQSPELDVLLKTMMKESDNLIADSLFKTIGASYFQRAGNFRSGGKAVKAILAEQGVDLENAYLADGSGLSRHNLMSAELFMSVLQFVYKNDQQFDLLSSFSVAGIDGTLKYHRAVRGKQFKGKVIAKTGSMKGVANLLGVVKTEQGDRLFVLILNGYNKPDVSDEARLNDTVQPSNILFGKAFFETILHSPVSERK